MASKSPDNVPQTQRIKLLCGSYNGITDSNVLVEHLVEFPDGEVICEDLLIPEAVVAEMVNRWENGSKDLRGWSDDELDELFAHTKKPAYWQVTTADYFHNPPVSKSRHEKSIHECAIEVLYDDGYPIGKIGRQLSLSSTEVEEVLMETGHLEIE